MDEESTEDMEALICEEHAKERTIGEKIAGVKSNGLNGWKMHNKYRFMGEKAQIERDRIVITVEYSLWLTPKLIELRCRVVEDEEC